MIEGEQLMAATEMESLVMVVKMLVAELASSGKIYMCETNRISVGLEGKIAPHIGLFLFPVGCWVNILCQPNYLELLNQT